MGTKAKNTNVHERKWISFKNCIRATINQNWRHDSLPVWKLTLVKLFNRKDNISYTYFHHLNVEKLSSGSSVFPTNIQEKQAKRKRTKNRTKGKKKEQMIGKSWHSRFNNKITINLKLQQWCVNWRQLQHRKISYLFFSSKRPGNLDNIEPR